MTSQNSEPLSPEDLSMLYSDQPRQRTTMSMLMLLDRQPDPERLRAAVWRAIEAVPRMRQRVMTSPFDLSLPRWEDDTTFDLDFHVRRYAEAATPGDSDELQALFQTVGPIYERPFDESRPLWELIEIERPGDRAAIFFRLHHAMADGVGGNAILAAMTDADRTGVPTPIPPKQAPGRWPDEVSGPGFAEAVIRRVGEDLTRVSKLAGVLWQGLQEPSSISNVVRVVEELSEDASFESGSPLEAFGRTRHLSGIALDFELLRAEKKKLGGQMIDLLLTGVAGAMGMWHRARGHHDVRELLTLVPINLRPPSELGLAAAIGNRTTGITVRIPIAIDDPLERFRVIHERVQARKSSPSVEMVPTVAHLCSGAPRWLYRRYALQVSGAIDLIVTNVPGIPVPRYVAGAKITAGYPIAPTAPHTPVSIALYGYDGQLFIGLDADATAMTDLGEFESMLRASFSELEEAVNGLKVESQ